jgi:hypothetical protein
MALRRLYDYNLDFTKSRYIQALVVIAVLTATVAQIRAKTVDYTPDFSSNATWDVNSICTVRITAAGKDDQGRDDIVFDVENQFSGPPVDRTGTLPVSGLWFGKDQDEPVPIAPQDRLLLVFPKDDSTAIVAIPLNTSEGVGTLSAVQRIASLRAHPQDLQAYGEAVFQGEPIVSRYALGHLLEETSPRPAPGFVAPLRRLREDESRETRVRLLATRLADKLAGQLDYSDDEYAWLQRSLAGSSNPDWTQLIPFIDRLLEFESRRPESVRFFARVATDSRAKESVRIAAYSAFDDPRIFHFETSDSLNDEIFQACMQMLKDPEPAMRAAGATLLHNITMRVGETVRANYSLKSGTAIREALATEQDNATRETLHFYLQQSR